jgi:hypothetical protein
MKILEQQGFSDFRVPAYYPDFDCSPGNFDRNLPESDVQLGGLQSAMAGDFSDQSEVQLTSKRFTCAALNLGGGINAHAPPYLSTLKPSAYKTRLSRLFRGGNSSGRAKPISSPAVETPMYGNFHSCPSA